MTTLFFDTEVKGPYPGALKKLGLDMYSRHKDTRISLVSYAIDDGNERVIDTIHGEPVTQEFAEAWADPHVQIVAHSAQFDRVVTKNRWLSVPHINRWYCTKACAYTVGLPGELDLLSKIFDLGEDAKKDGKRLITLFCERGADPDQHLADWLLFCEYASFDITALRRLYHLLPKWGFGDVEQRRYHTDQRINDRGFKIDRQLANQIIEMCALGEASLHRRIQKLTSGKIERGTQGERIKAYLNTFNTHGFDTLKAESIRKVLRDDKAGAIVLDPAQRELLEIRLLSSKSSISKCHTALAQAGPGDRIRYAMNYHGGGRIGRWSHKGFQPGNMPRPSMEPEEIEAAIEILQMGGVTAHSIWGDQSLEVGSNAIRGLIIAEDGHKLVAADWSNIEGRKLAWYATEQWKLDAYAQGLDMYRLVGGRMTGRDPDSFTKKERQGFKGCELSMGYEGGVGAYVNVANAYQVDLVELAKDAPRVLAPEYLKSGMGSWNWALRRRETEGLPREVYVACAAYKFAWRDACPATTALWEELLNKAKAAVASPGTVHTAAGGKVVFKCSPGWLAVRIPSGRLIMFAKPKFGMERQFEYDEAGNKIEVEPRPVLTALKSPSWRREALYGGLIANAITQGGCRDILADGVDRAEADGWPVILTVHDEIIAELPDADPRDHTDLEALMNKLPPWCGDMPIAAEGFTSKRYHK